MAVTNSFALRKDAYRLRVCVEGPDLMVSLDSGDRGTAIALDRGEAKLLARAIADLAEGVRD